MITVGKRRSEVGSWIRTIIVLIAIVVLAALSIHYVTEMSKPGQQSQSQHQQQQQQQQIQVEPHKPFVFIDLGAGNGDTLRSFYKAETGVETDESHVELPYEYDPDEWRVYALEANAKYSKALQDLQQKFSFTLHEETATWTKEGKVRMFLNTGDQGCYIKPSEGDEKVGTKGDGFTVIPSIDFSKWLKGNVRPNDFVVVRMNIGGSEFEILDKMITDRTFCLIDQLYVFYHAKRVMTDKQREMAKNLPGRIRRKSLAPFCQVQILFDDTDTP